MKKIRIIFILIIIFCFSCSKCKKTTGKKYNLSVVVGSQFYWGQGAKMFADLVREKTNGEIDIKVYYGGQLFKGAQTSEFQLLSKGVIDFAWGSTINWSPVIKKLNIFSLPFFIDNYKKLDKIENGKIGEQLFNFIEQKGVKPLAWAENGFRQLTNSKHPINKVSDLKNLKIRVVGSPIFIDIFKSLGANPVSMNWGDAVTGFSQGVVDGQENPVDILLAVKIWEYHKYCYIWNYAADPVIVAVNLKKWNNFPDNIKSIISNCAKKSARWEKAYCRLGLDDGNSEKILNDEFNQYPDLNYLNTMKNHGMKITKLTSQQKLQLVKKTKPVYLKWLPIIGYEFYESVRTELNK